MKREIKIKAKKEDVQKIIDELFSETTDNLEFILDVPDKKETYGRIYNCPFIIDWNFISDLSETETGKVRNEISNDEIQRTNSEAANQNKKKIEITTKTNLNIDIVNFNNLADFIIAWWSMIKENDGQIDLNLLLKYYNLLSKSESLFDGMNNLMVKTLLEFRYNNNIDIAVPDVKNKLDCNKNDLKKCNLISEVTALLFTDKKNEL